MSVRTQWLLVYQTQSTQDKECLMLLFSFIFTWFVRYSCGTWKSMSCALHGVSAQGPPKVGYSSVSEFRFRPRVVRSAPRARLTRFGSVSAARMNVWGKVNRFQK